MDAARYALWTTQHLSSPHAVASTLDAAHTHGDLSTHDFHAALTSSTLHTGARAPARFGALGVATSLTLFAGTFVFARRLSLNISTLFRTAPLLPPFVFSAPVALALAAGSAYQAACFERFAAREVKDRAAFARVLRSVAGKDVVSEERARMWAKGIAGHWMAPAEK